MSHTITITDDENPASPIYTQRVEVLNLKAILAAVNSEPPKSRADKGVPRGPRTDNKEAVKQ